VLVSMISEKMFTLRARIFVAVVYNRLTR
jgi:hypothetical protein